MRLLISRRVLLHVVAASMLFSGYDAVSADEEVQDRGVVEQPNPFGSAQSSASPSTLPALRQDLVNIRALSQSILAGLAQPGVKHQALLAQNYPKLVAMGKAAAFKSQYAQLGQQTKSAIDSLEQQIAALADQIQSLKGQAEKLQKVAAAIEGLLPKLMEEIGNDHLPAGASICHLPNSSPVTCALPHAATSCLTGVCAVVACHPGWANLDRNDSNGCETAVPAGGRR